MEKQREIRVLGAQMRASQDKESRAVEGYAALFESSSELLDGWFTETIARGAFDGVIAKSDVVCLLNHSQERGVLARCRQGQGSLELRVDDKGLFYRFEAPRTSLGDELLEGLRRGDITESSFAFYVERDSWEERPNGQYHRTILKVAELLDVSPVYQPAYKGTEVFARSLDSVKEELGKALDKPEERGEGEKKEEKFCAEDLEKHFCGVRGQFN